MTVEFDRPTKDESFMEIAQAVSMRSTCIRRRYGAVIVSKDGRIVATGYNGAPRHRANCSDLGTCLREQLKIKPGTHYELCRAVHAEANAIINGNPLDVVGGTLYLAGTEVKTGKPTKSMRPCAMCERMILNAQIARVVLRDENGKLFTVNPLEWEDDIMQRAIHTLAQEGNGPTSAPAGGCGCGGCCGA
ncbi:MAG: dCMP deaminase family protein [Candidatus Anaerobiospirillum merdipullorum]|uniref:dCMP deaminase family protein n=1 Tax=Candidatus Anaerobiospirillum merdipullorum TaxID=2838450 RepID=A0A9E2KPJ6_9GAMM|nr:dCMP deaminase family protein [Candidatus Anaerobiospirillum merdipullorum]